MRILLHLSRSRTRPERPRRVSALVLLTLLVALTAPALAAPTADEIRTARDAVLHRLDLQRELPAGPEEQGFSWNLKLPPEFFLFALLLGLGIIAYQFRGMVPAWRRRGGHGWESGEAPTVGQASSTTASTTSHADELARQGRYVDAMHVLLLHSLATIRERLNEPFADSLTSREILRGTRLSEAGKASLRDIVARVEWTYFGDHPADRNDYESCRARYDQLHASLRPEATA